MNIRQKVENNPNYINKLRNLRVIVLALSAFIFITTEFIPVALLSDIANSFAMPVEQVGLMITLYAWIVSLLSLPAMLVTAQMERRKLLIYLFILFIGSHILSAIAQNFTVLLIARTGVALAHAVFWAITASLVVRVAPRGKQTQALGILAMGSALATVLGLPLGRVVGQYVSWRVTFAMIGVIAMLVMGLLCYLLPRLPSKDVGSLASLPSILKNTALIIMYILTVLAVTTHFTAYSYVEPFIKQMGFNDNWVTVILLIFGLAGMMASILFSRYYERYPDMFLFIALLGLLFCLVLMAPLANISWIWGILAFTWGISITAISLVLQLRVLKLAPKATDVAMAIFSGIYNIGIGAGALFGNQVIIYLGLQHIGFVAGGILLFALLIFIIFSKKSSYL